MVDRVERIWGVIKGPLKRFLTVATYVTVAVFLTPGVQIALHEWLGVWITDSATLLLVNSVLAALGKIVGQMFPVGSLVRKAL